MLAPVNSDVRCCYLNVEQTFTSAMLGVVCADLLVQEYRWSGALISPVNVVFICANDGSWFRFFFDAGVFFWKKAAALDGGFVEGEHSYQIVRVSEAEPILGQAIRSVAFADVESSPGRKLVISFDNGAMLELQDENDENTLLVRT